MTRLLVVDDEVTIRNFIVRVLEREGYEVYSAGNGQEAIILLNNTPFDLILTDIKMEHMNGVTLLKVAKSIQPDIVVVLFTGHATVQSAVEALRQGAYDYLLKPVKNEDIIRVVADGLRIRDREIRRDQLEVIADQMLKVIRPDTPMFTANRQTIIYGALKLDLGAYTARLYDQPLDLTPTEFRLLAKLAQNPGNAFEFVHLVQVACGYTCTRQEAREIIGTHVLNLRQKMAVKAGEPYYVASVRGIGYRLLKPDEN
ncbi:MAG: response regulator transcription factor [Phototrophicales bacterium]